MPDGKLEETPLERAKFAVANPDVMHSPQAMREIMQGLADDNEMLATFNTDLREANNNLRKAIERIHGEQMRDNATFGASRRTFADRIRAMNKMYDLPICKQPTRLGADRLRRFWNTLHDEVEEGTDIIVDLRRYEECSIDAPKQHYDLLTDLADWLADIVVYCRSEAMKWGIPLEEVLDIVMDSNESKLGADGKPIKDENGKFLKGPNYWKPEPKIRELLEARSQ